MNLLDEYLKAGRIRFNIDADDVEVLVDSENEFSIKYIDRRGEPMIMGVNRNTETFWRNRAESLE